MKTAEIRELYSYNNWANDKLLQFLNTLSWDDFTGDMSSSFGSIHNTVIHILGAEELWLSRWSGGKINTLLDPALFQDFISINDRWSGHQANTDKYIASLTDGLLEQSISYKNLKETLCSSELWKQMLHVANHSTYHRGQIVTMVRQLNLQPPTTDLIYYYLGNR